MKLLIIKQFTSGLLKGESFIDQLEVKTVNDLNWLDRVGQEIESISSNYRIGGVSIWDKTSGDYITRKQAEWKLKGC